MVDMTGTRTTYADIAFGPHVRARQEKVGAHLRITPPGDEPFRFDPRDRALIRSSDLFFLSTVTESGWPYVQHRGGPPGFVHVIDERTLAFPDFPGNQQFVTTGNLDHDGRVCLFFVDFPTRRRLKVFGTAHTSEDADLITAVRDLGDSEIRSRIERVVVVAVTDVDVNCTSHIRPRWDRAAVDERIALYRADIARLQARIAELEAAT